MLDIIDKGLLQAVADLSDIPITGAYNIRKNGQGVSRRSTENIQIIPKTDKPGIDININPTPKENRFTSPSSSAPKECMIPSTILSTSVTMPML